MRHDSGCEGRQACRKPTWVATAYKIERNDWLGCMAGSLNRATRAATGGGSMSGAANDG